MEKIDEGTFSDVDELAGNLGTICASIGMQVYDHKGGLLTKWEVWQDGDVVKLVIK